MYGMAGEDVLACQGKCREGAHFGLIVNIMIQGDVRHILSQISKESKSCWTTLYRLINFISSDKSTRFQLTLMPNAHVFASTLSEIMFLPGSQTTNGPFVVSLDLS